MIFMESVSAEYLFHLFSPIGNYNDLVNISNFARREKREMAFASYKLLGIDGIVNIDEDITKGTNTDIVIKVPIIYPIHDFNTIAYMINIAHSHPSGNNLPSKEDLDLLSGYRKQLRDFGKMDVRLISSIIAPLDKEGDHALFICQEKTQEPMNTKDTYEIHKEFLSFISQNWDKRQRIKVGQNYYSFPSFAEFFNKTGCYNVLETQFNEKSGLHIPQKDLENFSFNVDTSNINLHI